MTTVRPWNSRMYGSASSSVWTLVCSAGAATRYDVAALAEAVTGEEVEYAVELPGDGAEAEVFFSDLSHEYVTINADYTT